MQRKENKADLVRRLEQELATVAAERRAGRAEAPMLAARTRLKLYQSERLAHTHGDLLAEADTHGAALFFLEELYGAHDLSQRDTDLERIVPTMRRMLSVEALAAITDAIMLDALSERLDTRMAVILGADFSEQQYLAAYRSVSPLAQRVHQLELVQALGEALCELVRIPFLATTLAIMRAPARMAGLGELQQFLERGFSTFKAMERPQQFVATIVGRERAVLDNIYAGRERPFEL